MTATDRDLAPASGLRAPQPPWYETTDFRALAEVRRSFTASGPPRNATRTPGAGAQQAAFWTLYELGHVLDELERRTREGAAGACIVRTREIRPGHVMVELVVDSPARGGADG